MRPLCESRINHSHGHGQLFKSMKSTIIKQKIDLDSERYMSTPTNLNLI